MADKHETHQLNDQTRFAMPVRNLISLVVAVALGVWAYFGIIERLNKIETGMILVQSDLVKNTEFRIKWPRGEMGALPADQQQDMLIEFMATQIEGMAEEMESMMSNTVNIKRSQQDIERLLNDVEKLKDKIRENGNGGN